MSSVCCAFADEERVQQDNTTYKRQVEDLQFSETQLQEEARDTAVAMDLVQTERLEQDKSLAVLQVQLEELKASNATLIADNAERKRAGFRAEFSTLDPVCCFFGRQTLPGD